MNIQKFREEFNKDYSSNLFRSFVQIEHLEEFLEGDIRLGHYKYYSQLKTEDDRFNPNEGILRNIKLQRRAGFTRLISSGGLYPTYSICFSRAVSPSYGQYVVKLNNPQEFHRRVNAFLACAPNANYAGNMVYTNEVEMHEEDDSRFLHIYSDTLVNRSKEEYRFSYDIFFPDALAMMPKGSIYSENECYKGHKHLPFFIHLKGIQVRDLCEVFPSSK